MATSTRVKPRAPQANPTREVARVSSPRHSMFGMADLTRNVKEAAREILKREIDNDSACARRREKELRRGADTLLGVDMCAWSVTLSCALGIAGWRSGRCVICVGKSNFICIFVMVAP